MSPLAGARLTAAPYGLLMFRPVIGVRGKGDFIRPPVVAIRQSHLDLRFALPVAQPRDGVPDLGNRSHPQRLSAGIAPLCVLPADPVRVIRDPVAPTELAGLLAQRRPVYDEDPDAIWPSLTFSAIGRLAHEPERPEERLPDLLVRRSRQVELGRGTDARQWPRDTTRGPVRVIPARARKRAPAHEPTCPLTGDRTRAFFDSTRTADTDPGRTGRAGQERVSGGKAIKTLSLPR